MKTSDGDMGIRQTLDVYINYILGWLGYRIERKSRYRIRGKQKLNVNVNLVATKAALSGRIKVLVLGSLDDDFDDAGELSEVLEVYSLDAVQPATAKKSRGNVMPIRRVVSGYTGRTKFIERKAVGVSSLLEPHAELITKYGLGQLYQESVCHEVDAVSLADLSEELGVNRWDYIKTDLEGMDFDVIKGLGQRLAHCSLVQMELRFEPFYLGEPYFHEVAAFMHSQGFTIIDMKPEWWRAATENMLMATQGRAVFCNVTFANNSVFDKESPENLRHILILCMCGFVNLAEQLLDTLAQNVRSELERLMYDEGCKQYLPFPGLPNVTVGTADS